MSFAILLLVPAVSLLIFALLFQLYYALQIVPLFDKDPVLKEEVFPAIPWSEPVEFINPQGLILRGSYYTQQDRESLGLILFVPEYQASHFSAWKYCQGLHSIGYEILSVNLTGQGHSDSLPGYQPRYWVTRRETEDLTNIITQLHRHPRFSSQLHAVFGISRGGAIALVVASRLNTIQNLIVEGAYSNNLIIERAVQKWMTLILPDIFCKTIPMWHIRKTVLLGKLIYQYKSGLRFVEPESFKPDSPTRMLLIAGQKDKHIPPEFAPRLQELLGCDSQIMLIKDASHNQARKVNPAYYDHLLNTFLQVSKTVESVPLPVNQAVTS